MTQTDIKQIHDDREDSKYAFFRGSLDHVYSLYQSRARDAGKTVLDLANFWHKFCLCFPDSGRVCGRQSPSDIDYDSLYWELAIVVEFKSTALADKIDALGWFTAEGEAAVLDAFVQAQDTLQNDGMMAYCAVGKLAGSVSELHSAYQEKAREKGNTVLEFEDFWNRFRHRFPGSGEGKAVYCPEFFHHTNALGPAVFVSLRPNDSALASLIDEYRWFRRNEVLDAFIREQDTLSKEPYLEDSREPDPDYDDQISWL